MKFFKDGMNYYSSDRRFWLERCVNGYAVYQISDGTVYDYLMAVNSLNEFRLFMKNSEGGDNYS